MHLPVEALRIAHVNDVASVGPALVSGLRAVGVDARFVEVPKLAARWPYPWKLAAYPVRIAWLAGLSWRLHRQDVHVTHIHYASQAILGPMTRRPYVVHCHGTDVRGADPASRWGRSLAPWLRRAAGVIYATPDLEPWVRAFRKDAQLLPGPVDTDVFKPRAGEPSADVLISTRLDPIKGSDQILVAARELLRRRPSTTFTVVEHGTEADAIRSIIGSAGTYLAPLPHETMPGLLARHSVFLGQLALGVSGQAEAEALSTGMVVVSRTDPRWSIDPAPPIVSAVDGLDAAASVARLLDNPEVIAHLGAAGRAWAVAERSIATITARLIDQYRSFGVAA